MGKLSHQSLRTPSVMGQSELYSSVMAPTPTCATIVCISVTIAFIVTGTSGGLEQLGCYPIWG